MVAGLESLDYFKDYFNEDLVHPVRGLPSLEEVLQNSFFLLGSPQIFPLFEKHLFSSGGSNLVDALARFRYECHACMIL